MIHADSDIAIALRYRLLLALGIGISTPGCHVARDCENPSVTTTVSLDALNGDSGDTARDTAPPLESCPSDEDQARDLLYAGEVACDPGDIVLKSESGRECTYEHFCMICCGYGRPFLDASGAPALAETGPNGDWSHGPHSPRVHELSEAERAEIGAYWLQNARAEHSSVAGFHRFTLDLLARGAPPELIGRAQAAAAQELRHALDCFGLASRYLGRPMGPGPLDMGGRAVIATSLAQLAAWTARDGAVGETLAAYLAERALVETTDPAVRAVLDRIVRDETGHAELAWATIRWAIDLGGVEVREAVRAVFDQLGEPKAHTGAWMAHLAAHGVPNPADEKAAAEFCIEQVILPVAEALLGRALAA